MALKNLYDSKPVKIHILGEPAEGELKRPFKAGGMFGKSILEYEGRRRNLSALQELQEIRRRTRRPLKKPRSESEPRRRTDFIPTCTRVHLLPLILSVLLITPLGLI